MTTMKKSKLILAVVPAITLIAAPAFAAEQSFNANSLAIDNFVGRVQITTASVDRIKVDIDNGQGVMQAPTAELAGNVLHVGYDYRQKVRNCSSSNNFGAGKKVRLRIKGGSMHDLEAFPSVRITVPQGTELAMKGGAVFGSAQDMGKSYVGINSCGDFRMGNVAGDFGGQINGSGDLSVGNVSGAADLGINGSGDLETGDISKDASLAINGSGDIDTGAVQALQVGINGSGDVKVASVSGPVKVTINGSGDIRVVDGQATPFAVTVRGSGDVSFGGHAKGVEYNLSGSGDISVKSFEGDLKRIGPKADVQIRDGHLHVGN